MIVGLTGGIGSGKSLCSAWLARQGVPVVDADVIARHLLAPQSALLPQIAQTLGADLLHADGTLNRAALRAKIFADDNARIQLNAVMHPAIRAEILGQLRQQSALSSSYVLLSAPLLLENGLDGQCNAVVVVDIAEQEQVARTLARDGCTPEQVHAIMASQCTRTKRLAAANFVVDNSGTVEQTYAQLALLHAQLQQHAKRLAVA